MNYDFIMKEDYGGIFHFCDFFQTSIMFRDLTFLHDHSCRSYFTSAIPSIFQEFKTGSSDFPPLALRIMGIALRLARQCQDNGLVKYWLKNSPGKIS